MEIDQFGFSSKMGSRSRRAAVARSEKRRNRSARPCAPLPDRLWRLADGMRLGMSNQELFALTKIDPWFSNRFAKSSTLNRNRGGTWNVGDGRTATGTPG